MKYMQRLARSAGLSFFFATGASVAHAQDAPDELLKSTMKANVALDKDAKNSVEACWSHWKEEQGLREGKNERNGHLILVSYQQQAVNAEPDSRSWLGARKFAFETAEIEARHSLAATMKTMLSAERSAAVQMLGGDDPAPSLQETSKQLSIADKANVLVDKALDNEIKKYDPKWDPNASPSEKKEEIINLQARMQDNIAAHSELYASGAFTAVQCEGPSKNDGGRYSVLIGMIWSPKLAKVAESIWNPLAQLPSESAGKTLDEQFQDFTSTSPNWLAYSMGARVFTNEKGEHVVVGFGVAPQTSLMSADKRRATLDALAAIDHFVGEKIEANAEMSDTFEHREYNSGKTQFFDTSAFNDRVVLRSKAIKLQGAAEVLSWRGEHPWSNAKMEVVAFAWSPSWAKDSEQQAAQMQTIEDRMNGEGAVPPATPSGTARRFHGTGAAVPAHRGASSSTRDF